MLREHAYLDHLAGLHRDLDRRLQVLSDHRDRLHDRAQDIERGDRTIEASHARRESDEFFSVCKGCDWKRNRRMRARDVGRTSARRARRSAAAVARAQRVAVATTCATRSFVAPFVLRAPISPCANSARQSLRLVSLRGTCIVLY
jgi:hypothetical protein